MVDLPLFSQPSLKQQLSGHTASRVTLEQLEQMNEQQRQSYVLVVQDPFTSYYDAKVVADFVRLIENWVTSRYYYHSHQMVRLSILKVF